MKQRRISRFRVHGGKIWWSEGEKENFLLLFCLSSSSLNSSSIVLFFRIFIVIQHSFLLHFHFYDSPFFVEEAKRT